MRRRNRLTSVVRSCLFLLSYSPLFLIISIREVHRNKEYLHWGGINKDALIVYLQKFLFPTVLILLILLAVFGVKLFLSNMDERISTNGVKVKVCGIDNRNNETVSYLATYIIPFLFQDFSDVIDIVSVVIIFLMIFGLYVNSSLIVINPILNIKYALYEIEYVEDSNRNVVKKGMIISDSRHLMINDEMKIKDIGYQIFMGKFCEEDLCEEDEICQ